MLDNDNIMIVKASEVVQRIPTDGVDYHKCSLCVIVSIQPQHIQQRRLDANQAHLAQLKETTEDILKLYRKRCNNWPMISFTHNGSETRIYKISSGNKLDDMCMVASCLSIGLFQKKSKQVGEGGRLRAYSFENNPWNFQICHFTPGNFRGNEASPPEIPQNCVSLIGISKPKPKTHGNSTRFFVDHL